MVSTLARPGREIATKLVLLQAGVVLATAILMALAINVDWGKSALIGGGIFVIANAVFASCAFLFSGARAAKFVVASFFGGEVLKNFTDRRLVCPCLPVCRGGTCSPQTGLFAGIRD